MRNLISSKEIKAKLSQHLSQVKNRRLNSGGNYQPRWGWNISGKDKFGRWTYYNGRFDGEPYLFVTLYYYLYDPQYHLQIC